MLPTIPIQPFLSRLQLNKDNGVQRRIKDVEEKQRLKDIVDKVVKFEKKQVYLRDIEKKKAER